MQISSRHANTCGHTIHAHKNRSNKASVIYYCARPRGIFLLAMTHFPQPHPSRRAVRVQLGDSVLAAIRLEDGRRTKAKLQTISATGGLLRLARSLGQGDFVEVAFQTQSGPVHGMAEVLSPARKLEDRRMVCCRECFVRSRYTGRVRIMRALPRILAPE